MRTFEFFIPIYGIARVIYHERRGEQHIIDKHISRPEAIIAGAWQAFWICVTILLITNHFFKIF